MDNKKSKYFTKGIFTLSLDTELGWGMIDKPLALINNKEYFYNARGAIDGIIELLEKYEIAATWAIVGSLLMDKPDFREEFINNIIIDMNNRVKEQYIDLLSREEIWCGKDIIQKIKSCSIPQEIGSHSHTHIIFGDKTVTSEMASKEFIESWKVLNQQNVELISFVFPRNSINYLGELKNSGFKVYRGVQLSWYLNMPERFRKIFHIFDQLLFITPSVSSPIYHDGLTNIPASMLYLPMNGFRKFIPLKSRIKKAEKGIKKAVDRKQIFHLWFHPFNIATNQKKLLYGLEYIFNIVNEERSRGNIEVMTMGEVGIRGQDRNCVPRST